MTGQTPSVAHTVNVMISDSMIMIPHNIAAGETAFSITNSGAQPHRLEIEGNQLHLKLDHPLQPGKVATLRGYVHPGEYRVICPDAEPPLSVQLCADR